MELYIEKEFLDNFYLDYSSKPIQEIVKEIFIRYGEKRVFIDFNSENFGKLDAENEFFALISNIIPPTPVNSIKEHLFSQSDFSQTIVFTNNEEDWFEAAGNKGALCFNFDNYQKKIKEIIDKLHFKIDLSEGFEGWEFLQKIKAIKYNELFVSDGYILSDKTNQRIEDNIIPILKSLVSDRNKNINIFILTKDLGPIKPEEKYKKEKAKKRHLKLNSVFANYNTKFAILLNDFPFDFVLHDRNIATNFSLMDCGEGFNLIPYKASNSQIISETIFDKYTYDRLKNIKKQQIKYIEKLRRLETLKFKMYPEK